MNNYITLKYGNTATYFVNGLLIDTDMAGTLPAFRRALKQQGLALQDIKYLFATHYHPDHIGLTGELMQMGCKLLLLEHQRASVHFSDQIYARQNHSPFVPIDEEQAILLSIEQSRAFLSTLGIAGEFVPNYSHSPDGASLVLDDGNAFTGDLEPLTFLDGYPENSLLAADWNALLSRGAAHIHPSHTNSWNV